MCELAAIYWTMSVQTAESGAVRSDQGILGLVWDGYPGYVTDDFDRVYVFEQAASAPLITSSFFEDWVMFRGLRPGPLLVSAKDPPEDPVPVVVLPGRFSIVHVTEDVESVAGVDVVNPGRVDPVVPAPVRGAILVQSQELEGVSMRFRRLRVRCDDQEVKPTWHTRTSAAWTNLPETCDPIVLLHHRGETLTGTPRKGRRTWDVVLEHTAGDSGFDGHQ